MSKIIYNGKAAWVVTEHLSVGSKPRPYIAYGEASVYANEDAERPIATLHAGTEVQVIDQRVHYKIAMSKIIYHGHFAWVMTKELRSKSDL